MAIRERVRVTHEGGGVSKTKQSDALASDVNNIMARYITHGSLPLNGRTPTYGDFTGVSDFHDSMNRVRTAEQDFAELPAAVRRHVDNDPGKFLDLVFDDSRRQELVELGLVAERVPDVPSPTPAAAEPEVPVPEE